MRVGYVKVKMNFWYGSHKYIGSLFTTQAISGCLVNMKPDWIFLILYMDQIGLLVKSTFLDLSMHETPQLHTVCKLPHFHSLCRQFTYMICNNAG